jgi:hypothetical protein
LDEQASDAKMSAMFSQYFAAYRRHLVVKDFALIYPSSRKSCYTAL